MTSISYIDTFRRMCMVCHPHRLVHTHTHTHTHTHIYIYSAIYTDLHTIHRSLPDRQTHYTQSNTHHTACPSTTAPGVASKHQRAAQHRGPHAHSHPSASWCVQSLVQVLQVVLEYVCPATKQTGSSAWGCNVTCSNGTTCKLPCVARSSMCSMSAI